VQLDPPPVAAELPVLAAVATGAATAVPAAGDCTAVAVGDWIAGVTAEAPAPAPAPSAVAVATGSEDGSASSVHSASVVVAIGVLSPTAPEVPVSPAVAVTCDSNDLTAELAPPPVAAAAVATGAKDGSPSSVHSASVVYGVFVVVGVFPPSTAAAVTVFAVPVTVTITVLVVDPSATAVGSATTAAAVPVPA